jgi:hypothetical protein
MLEIGNTIISLDIIEEHFICDVIKCKGVCCEEGDSGAPLTKNEAKKIEEVYPVVKEFLPETNIEAINEHGLFFVDGDGDLVTSLMNKRECVFAFRDETNIFRCAFEKAYSAAKTGFRKPLSCHLFPIRITEYKNYDAVNYQRLGICKPGRVCGTSQKMPLYRFLKESLIRKYGEEWYEQLEIAAEHIKNRIS